MAIKYDKDTDYKALMDAAIAAGDYKAAGLYEQQRNAKIAGEGITQYQQSHDLGSVYDQQYMTNDELGKAYQMRQAAQSGGTDWGSAHSYTEQIRNSYGYSGGTDGSKYISTAVPVQKPQSFSYQSAPAYVNQYQDLIDELRGKILEQDPFSYDAESDPLYQQYRDSYTRGGQQAMRDALGQLSARTGGLASSYAGSAAQQTYDGYMSALSDKIPELRQLAYQMYQDEGEKQRLNLEMIAALEREDYNKYQNLLSQYNTDRSLAYQQYTDQLAQYNTDRDFIYNMGRDQLNDSRYDAQWQYQLGRDQLNDQRYDDETAWNRGIYQDETDYDRKQDQYQKDAQRAALLASGGDFSGYAELWGLSEEQTQGLSEQYARQKGLSEDQAARELADWYAQYGDFSKLGELGVDTDWLLQQRAAPASSAYSGSGGGSYSSGGGSSGRNGEPNQGALFAAALNSQNPQNYISSHYKEYGFTSVSGLYDAYKTWNPVVGKTTAQITPEHLQRMTDHARKLYEAVGQDDGETYAMLKKLGWDDGVIDMIFSQIGL